jgi:pimeloyl-ACP methyl ester carboxylesterase
VVEPLPIVLVPGLSCSARLYAEQLPQLWCEGPVTIADHTRADSMAELAHNILAAAPPRFALAGLSMGGYISFEIMRQAPERVVKLALLDTMAAPDSPVASERRRAQMALAREGRLREVIDSQIPRYVHPERVGDSALRAIIHAMAEEVGEEGFHRQQVANMNRMDSGPTLARIRCPTLVLVGDSDQLTPPERAEEMAAEIERAKLVKVPGCGHLSTLERPREVTEALLQWLRT